MPECEAAEDIADPASLEAAESEMRAWRDGRADLGPRRALARALSLPPGGRMKSQNSSSDDCMKWAGDMEPPLMGRTPELGAGRLYRRASGWTSGVPAL